MFLCPLNHLTAISLAVLTSIAMLALPGSLAAAQTPLEQALDMLRADAEISGYELSYDSAEAKGDDIVITGIAMRIKNAPEGMPVARSNVRKILIRDVRASDDGSLSATEMVLQDYRVTIDGPHAGQQISVVISIADMRLRDVAMPSPELRKKQLLAGYVFGGRLSAFELHDLRVNINKEIEVKLESMTGKVGWSDDGILESYKFESTPARFPNPPTDSQPAALLRALGEEAFTLSVSLNAAFDADSKRASIEPLRYAFDNVAAMEVSLDIGNIDVAPPDNIDEIEIPEGPVDFGAAMREKMMLWDLRSMSIRLRSDKLIDPIFVLAAQNSMPSVYDGDPKRAIELTKQGAIAAIPGMLQAVEHPELAKSAADAVEKFLTQPEKYDLIILANPEKPVGFANLAGTAVLAPKTLLWLLGVDVTAECRDC